MDGCGRVTMGQDGALRPPPFETPRGRGSSGSAGLGAMRVAGTTYYERGAEGPGRRRAGTATRSASARKGKQSPVSAANPLSWTVNRDRDLTHLSSVYQDYDMGWSPSGTCSGRASWATAIRPRWAARELCASPEWWALPGTCPASIMSSYGGPPPVSTAP